MIIYIIQKVNKCQVCCTTYRKLQQLLQSILSSNPIIVKNNLSYSFAHSMAVYIPLTIFKLLPLKYLTGTHFLFQQMLKIKGSNSVQNNHSYKLSCKLLHYKIFLVTEMARQDVCLICYALIIFFFKSVVMMATSDCNIHMGNTVKKSSNDIVF